MLWFHGLGADKEVHLPELQRFAAAGLLAIGVDAVGHGQRRLPAFEQGCGQWPHQNHRLFDSLVAQTVAELPRLIDALVDCGLSDERRIGVAGVSMGGCIVYRATAADRRIRAAVALLGSPLALAADEGSAAATVFLPVERFFPTALLSITAENDDVVLPDAVRRLHQHLLSGYRDDPDRLEHRVIAGAPHFMDGDDWAGALTQTSDWLSRFLR